jgi:hypothetical protein
MFNADYYLDTNPDVMSNGIDPLRHFIVDGAAEGRNPSPFFDTGYYLSANPDVAAAGMNPLLHYILHGASENRSTQRLTDSSEIEENNLQTDEDLESLYEMVRDSGLFDAEWYLNQYPDVATEGFDPLRHFIWHGLREDRNPNALFSAEWYANNYPDVEQTKTAPFIHFLKWGASQRKSPSGNFDALRYLRQNPDVEESGENPLVHYLRTRNQSSDLNANYGLEVLCEQQELVTELSESSSTFGLCHFFPNFSSTLKVKTFRAVVKRLVH